MQASPNAPIVAPEVVDASLNVDDATLRRRERCLRRVLHSDKLRTILLAERGITILLSMRLFNSACDKAVTSIESYWADRLHDCLHAVEQVDPALVADDDETNERAEDIGDVMELRRKRASIYHLLQLHAKRTEMFDLTTCNAFVRYKTLVALYNIQENKASLYDKWHGVNVVDASRVAFYALHAKDALSSEEVLEAYSENASDELKKRLREEEVDTGHQYLVCMWIRCPRNKTTVRLVLYGYTDAEAYRTSDRSNRCLLYTPEGPVSMDGTGTVSIDSGNARELAKARPTTILSMHFELEGREDSESIVAQGSVDSFRNSIQYFVHASTAKINPKSQKARTKFDTAQHCIVKTKEASLSYKVLTRVEVEKRVRAEKLRVERLKGTAKGAAKGVEHEPIVPEEPRPSYLIIDRGDYAASLRVSLYRLDKGVKKDAFLQTLLCLVDTKAYERIRTGGDGTVRGATAPSDDSTKEPKTEEIVCFPAAPTRALVLFDYVEGSDSGRILIENIFGIGDVSALLEGRNSLKSRTMPVESIELRSKYYAEIAKIRDIMAVATRCEQQTREVFAYIADYAKQMPTGTKVGEDLGAFLETGESDACAPYTRLQDIMREGERQVAAAVLKRLRARDEAATAVIVGTY